MSRRVRRASNWLHRRFSPAELSAPWNYCRRSRGAQVRRKVADRLRVSDDRAIQLLGLHFMVSNTTIRLWRARLPRWGRRGFSEAYSDVQRYLRQGEHFGYAWVAWRNGVRLCGDASVARDIRASDAPKARLVSAPKARLASGRTSGQRPLHSIPWTSEPCLGKSIVAHRFRVATPAGTLPPESFK